MRRSPQLMIDYGQFEIGRLWVLDLGFRGVYNPFLPVNEVSG